MTEAEWNACADPTLMLEFLRGKASDRKLQLFCCACCLGNEIAQDDDEPNQAPYLETLDWVDEQHRPMPAFWREGTWWPQMPFDWAKRCSRDDDLHDLPPSTKTDLLRCIFGNPFHPITHDPTWLTSTVQQLANSIYQDRAFDFLPILADALEDAGCTNASILEHCRSESEHVRGCWALDLVLGKE